MPDQLTAPTRSVSVAPAGRPPALVVAFQAGAVVAVLVLTGLAGALVWYQLWTPATGVVQDGRWLTDEDGLRDAFSGTGLYVLVAVLGGFLAGALTAFLFDRSELVTLVATIAGAALAGWVMLWLGLGWSPADPAVLARAAEDGTRLDSALTVDLPHAWLALPGGALLGMTFVFLVTTRRPDAEERRAERRPAERHPADGG